MNKDKTKAASFSLDGLDFNNTYSENEEFIVELMYLTSNDISIYKLTVKGFGKVYN